MLIASIDSPGDRLNPVHGEQSPPHELHPQLTAPGRLALPGIRDDIPDHLREWLERFWFDQAAKEGRPDKPPPRAEVVPLARLRLRKGLPPAVVNAVHRFATEPPDDSEDLFSFHGE